MQGIRQYLQSHSKSDPFSKQILNLNEQNLSSKLEVIKMEGKKLQTETHKLILENIEEILQGELQRMEIRNEMNEITRESPEDILNEFESILSEQGSQHHTHQFLVDKNTELSNLFEIPRILKTLKTAEPEEYNKRVVQLRQSLRQYPKISKLLLPVQSSQQKDQNIAVAFVEYNHLIKNKIKIDPTDAQLLEGPFAGLVCNKMKQEYLSQVLLDAWIPENSTKYKSIKKLQPLFRAESEAVRERLKKALQIVEE